MYLAWRLSATYESHSGYCFRGSWPQRYLGLTNGSNAEFHDFHHTDNRGNYGSEMLDYLFGTMDNWLLLKNLDFLSASIISKSIYSFFFTCFGIFNLQSASVVDGT